MFLDEKKLQIQIPEGLTKGEVTVRDNVVEINVTATQDGDHNIVATYNDGTPVTVPLKVLTPVYGSTEFTTAQTEFHPEDEMALVVKFSKKLPKLSDLAVTVVPAEAATVVGEPTTHEDADQDSYTVTYKYTAKQLGEAHKFNIVYKSGEPVEVAFKVTAQPELKQEGSKAEPADIENTEKSVITIPFAINAQ